MAADHVARIEAQHRADVARQVLDGLNGEKTAAETALAEARTELEAAARASWAPKLRPSSPGLVSLS